MIINFLLLCLNWYFFDVFSYMLTETRCILKEIINCILISNRDIQFTRHKYLNFAFKSQIQFFRLNNEEMRNFFYKYNSIYITFAFLLNSEKCNLNSFCYYKFSVHKRTQFKIYISHYEFNSCFEIGYSHMLYVFNLE